ncbi:MAG: WhiB family transcriptional regulator [Ilumatobacter sp.]|uniref:WhiB family transcriptional regulator n=1 Tax=Ilumatobacter sp. TaxID=1967498 RepID=UPI003296A88E
MSSLERQDRSGWQASAACAGESGSVFYPPLRAERRSVRSSREQRAKAVCASCPVTSECLDHALAHDERFGIWGGLTNRERRIAVVASD